MSQEIVTGTLTSWKTDIRNGYGVTLRKSKMLQKQHLVCRGSCFHHKSLGNMLSIRRSSSKRVNSCDGRTTRIFFLAQKPMVSQREREFSDDCQREQQQQWFEVGFPKNGWAARSTCGACTSISPVHGGKPLFSFPVRRALVMVGSLMTDGS